MESPHPISQRLHAYREYANYLISSPATGVIQVLIDRPHKYNTFTDRMWKDMGKLFRQISQDADFRAVILSATGALGFTAGLDIQEASQETAFNGNTAEDSARRALKIKTYIENFQAQLSEIEKCCKRKGATQCQKA
jgi:delta(3,5)-delta(2,4)-dienoyl-CoA isomerase